MTCRMLLVALAIAFGSAIAEAGPPPFLPGVQKPFSPRLPPLRVIPGLKLGFAPERCTNLLRLSLERTTISIAELKPAMPWTLGADTISLPAFCRIVGVARPTAQSQIGFEVWIPFNGTYRNRYLQVGNGGFSGVIPYDAMADGISRGYATAATDDGHVDVPWSAEFAKVNLNKIIDYGYRSLPETADRAKALIAAATGSAPMRSYFHGCSNGGRQALMLAQRYPELFDGIVVGAPANFFTHQFASFAWNAQQEYAPLPAIPTRRLEPERLSILSTAVQNQCTGTDGGLVGDHFLTNPLACHVNLAALTCAGPATPTCLTSAEVGVIQQVYAGPTRSSGEQIYPGLEPGAEAFPLNWPGWITGPSFVGPFGAQAHLGSSFFASFFNDPALGDLRNVDVSARVDAADTNFGTYLNAIKDDLRGFYDRGGKLIQYHGFDDAAVAPKNSINYWSSVSSRMRTLRPGLTQADIDNFYRLFMVPGMGHCMLGEGANEFGNGVRGTSMTPTHDLMQALERWVEGGVAPVKFVARHRSPPFERPLCPYPKLPRFNGSGASSDAANWSCVVPARFIPVGPKVLKPRPPFRVPIPDPPLRKPGH